MADVLVSEGRGYLRHPQTGMVIPVPEADIADAIAAGFVPTSSAETASALRKERYGGAGYGLLSGLAGAGRGATFGLSDVLLTKGGLAAPETLSALREANPTASSVGELGGIVGSMFVPASPVARLVGGAGKLGEAATAATARALGGSAARALPQLTGTLAREGAIGAALGVGGATTDVALAPGEMSPGEIAARLLGGGGKGLAWGSGLGALSWAARTGVGRLRDRYTLGLDEIRGLRTERAALEAERESLRASGAAAEQVAKLEAQLGGVAQELHDRQIGAIGKLFTRTAAYGLGHAIGGGVVGGLVGVIAAPKAIRLFQSALQPLEGAARTALAKAKDAIGPHVAAAWERVAPTAEAAWERVAPYVGRALETPIGQQAVDRVRGAVADAARKVPTVAEGLGFAAAHIPEPVASGAMLAGIPGAAAGLAVHRLSRPIGAAVEALTAKVAPAGRLAVLDALTDADWSKAAEELGAIDPASTDSALRALLPESTPPEVAEGVSSRVQSALSFLQTMRPASAGATVPVSAGGPQPSASAYQRALRAVVDPGSMLVAFAENRLAREQVRAWESVYPEALAQVRAMVAASVAGARASGGRFDRDRADSIAMLLGDEQAAPPLSRPDVVAQIQARHQAQRQQRTRAARKGRGTQSMGYLSATPMQRLARGGYR